MDISTSKHLAQQEDDGITITISGPDGDKLTQDDGVTPVTITVAGSYSQRYRKAANANRDKLLKQRTRTVGADDLDRQALDLLAACVIAWDGFTDDGKPYPLTRENAVALFDACPWIREQVESAVSDHARFFTKS